MSDNIPGVVTFVTTFKVKVQVLYSRNKLILETYRSSLPSMAIPNLRGSFFSELFKRNWFQTKQAHASKKKHDKPLGELNLTSQLLKRKVEAHLFF